MQDSKLMSLAPEETRVPVLGQPKVANPLRTGRFISDGDGVWVYDTMGDVDHCDPGRKVLFELAGPREKIYYDPAKAKCAVVTCGGLCPGLNNVIRAIVMEAHHNYGVAAVLGIRNGLAGFIPGAAPGPDDLTPDSVIDIHEFGGTALGSSRGPREAADIADSLERMNISALFMIGGDGTMRAAGKIQDEIAARGRKIAVIGVPKTIDNDISFVGRSFGFDTAVEKAMEAIRCAHTEALGAPGGIGVVKLMGRESGFIAAQASLAQQDVNFVLVPEDSFAIHGENGLLAALDDRIGRRGHAVIVVAEGAGQELVGQNGQKDASGNVKLGDISSLLITEIKEHFNNKGQEINLKFIDPSYIIRSIPANGNDRIYCDFLGRQAVHAAMAGKTGMVVSKWNGRYVHVPFDLVTRQRKRIDTESNYWRQVLESTGQPVVMK